MMAAPSPSKPAKRSNPQNQETSDDYKNIVVPGLSWRVIRCRGDIQFIIQRRWGGTRARPWEAVAYLYKAHELCPVLHRRSLGVPEHERDRIIRELTAQGIVNRLTPEIGPLKVAHTEKSK